MAHETPGAETPPPLDVETDPRFPSGPWKGFFLQPLIPGRHWMELDLTFRNGRLLGTGRDWVGRFGMAGRYDLADGQCSWVKTYVGAHEIHYRGFNEGKGIWGRWEFLPEPANHGGFHIWPVGHGFADPYALTEAIDQLATADVAAPEPVPV